MPTHHVPNTSSMDILHTLASHRRRFIHLTYKDDAAPRLVQVIKFYPTQQRVLCMQDGHHKTFLIKHIQAVGAPQPGEAARLALGFDPLHQP